MRNYANVTHAYLALEMLVLFLSVDSNSFKNAIFTWNETEIITIIHIFLTKNVSNNQIVVLQMENW